MRTELHWIRTKFSGRLAIMPRPRGGDWLEGEILSWLHAGIDDVVSLLQADEITELDLSDERRLCEANGVNYFSFPIPDRGVPESLDMLTDLTANISKYLAEGKNIAIHCRQGIGRAALVAIAILIREGLDLECATERVRLARGCPVPETAEQQRWLAEFEESVQRGQRTTIGST